MFKYGFPNAKEENAFGNLNKLRAVLPQKSAQKKDIYAIKDVLHNSNIDILDKKAASAITFNLSIVCTYFISLV